MADELDQRAREAPRAQGRRADVVVRIQGPPRSQCEGGRAEARCGRRAARHGTPSRRSYARERPAHGREARRRAVVPDLRPRHEGRVRRPGLDHAGDCEATGVVVRAWITRGDPDGTHHEPRGARSLPAGADDRACKGRKRRNGGRSACTARRSRRTRHMPRPMPPSRSRTCRWRTAYMPSNIAYDSSRAAARRALARDSLVADARALAAFANHGARLELRDQRPRDPRAAAAREPNSAQTQILYAVYLCTIGRTAEGLTAAQAAMTVDPLNPVASWSREECLYKGRRYDQLIAEHAQTVASMAGPSILLLGLLPRRGLSRKGTVRGSARRVRAGAAGGGRCAAVRVRSDTGARRKNGQGEGDAGATGGVRPRPLREPDHLRGGVCRASAIAIRRSRGSIARSPIGPAGCGGSQPGPSSTRCSQDPRLDQLIKRIGLPTAARAPQVTD